MKVDWKRIEKASLAVIGVPTLGTVVFLLKTIISKWSSLGPSQQVSVAANGIVAVGTLFLALATLITVFHSSRRVKEQELENLKPLARNEVLNFVQPAIETLRTNIDHFKQDYEVDWLQYNPSLPSSFGTVGIASAGVPTPIIPSGGYHSHALIRLERERPDLYQQIKEHDKMIHHLSSRADQISEQIDEQIREYIANNDLEKVSEEGDILTLKSAIIREANQDEEKSEHYSILSGHREDLLNILYSVAGNELEDFQKLEDSYWNHCEQVLDGLKKRKVELQDDYRFAIEDESGTSRIRKTNTGEIT